MKKSIEEPFPDNEGLSSCKRLRRKLKSRCRDRINKDSAELSVDNWNEIAQVRQRLSRLARQPKLYKADRTIIKNILKMICFLSFEYEISLALSCGIFNGGGREGFTVGL